MEAGRDAEGGDIASLLAVRDAQIVVLLERIVELEGLVAALRAQVGRDSSNSGMPPLSDSPFVKEPAAKRSVRTRSGKSRGKQPGSAGTTLELVADPDETIVHSPLVCGGCGGDLADAVV